MTAQQYLLRFAILFFTCGTGSAVSDAVTVQVTDANGDALANTVIVAPYAYASVSGERIEPAVMDQVDKAFFPHVLVVDQGRSVVFPNSDNIRHHVYSFSDNQVAVPW